MKTHPAVTAEHDAWRETVRRFVERERALLYDTAWKLQGWGR